MNVKTLALAAAAAAVATPSMAADLPVVAEPVNYVEACDAFGAGFFKLPGKDTCVKLGGRIRANVQSGDLTSDDDFSSYDGENYKSYVKGYLYFTSMTNTEFGTIKTFTETVAKWSGDEDNGDTHVSFDAGDVFLQLGMDYGSFLIGREASLFDSFTGYASIGPADTDLSDDSALQAMFTADLGNGFTASVAAQDSNYRGGESSAVDFLGALELSQAWGSAKVAGVLFDRANHDDYGYGVSGTVTVNLDMLREGTEFTFQAQYADEAGQYIDFADVKDDSGSVLITGADVSGYVLAAGIKTNVTETVVAALDATYTATDDLKNAAGVKQVEDFSKFALNGSVEYSPAAGLIFALDAGYEHAEGEIAGDDTDGDASVIAGRIQYTF